MSDHIPSECSESVVFPSTPSKNYRFFNQPIEQIPEWDPTKSQVLFHAANCGLVWQTFECIDVVTCIKLESSELVIETKKLFVLKTDNPDENACPNIPVTDCNCDESGDCV